MCCASPGFCGQWHTLANDTEIRSPVADMKLYQPVKDTPRRFCPTGWGLPRLSERRALKSPESQSPLTGLRAQNDKMTAPHLGGRARRRR
jgi:hypothetical protein